MTRGDLTIAEAAAWEAGRDAAVAEMRRHAEALRACTPCATPQALGLLSAIHAIADAAAAIQPPRALPDGLSGRGA